MSVRTCYASLIGMLALVGSAASWGEAPATRPQPAYSQASGPDGSYSAPITGVKLVDETQQIRPLWTSEDHDLDYCKQGASLEIMQRFAGHPGGVAGPIVADGKVSCASHRAAGETRFENLKAKATIAPEQLDIYVKATRVEADDIVVCMDLKTGKTLWKAVEERTGVNWIMDKRDGWGVAPAYHNGKIFSRGTTGLLF